jgi:hypothetical protein
MSSERFWVLLLTLTAFGAGVAAGVLLTLRRMPVPDTRPFAAYEARLTETFDLDERRVEYLRYILGSYHEEIEELKEQRVAELDDELVEIGRDHRTLIRTQVVPEHHRQQFDLWVDGLPVLSAGVKPR